MCPYQIIRKCLSGVLISALLLSCFIISERKSVYAGDASEGVTCVSLGDAHSAAIKTDGSLWMWGFNTDGQLGIGRFAESGDNHSNIPIKIMEGVKSVSLGGAHSAAIKNDGSLWMWGNNESGQLGNGTNVSSNIPIKIMEGVKSVSLGAEHSAAVKNDGSLWMWGSDSWGQLGNTTSGSNVPIKIMSGVKSVSIGEDHSAAIKTDGSLWVWGVDLANGSNEPFDEPIKVLDGVKAVSLGGTHGAAIKTDNSLWMWGHNSSWAVGNVSSSSEVYTPVKVMDGVKSVSLGGTHSAAIKADGSLWTWGSSGYGQLGYTGSLTNGTPTKVMDGVTSVSLGSFHSAAIKSDGSLWMWGEGLRGRLGDGIEYDLSGHVNKPKKIISGNNTNPSGTSGQYASSPSSSTGGGNNGSNAIRSATPAKSDLFGIKLTKVIKGKKSFTAKWKKASKKQQKKFSGYQIQYSTNPNFTTDVKTKSTTKKKASKVVIRKLKAKTNYYVRIRRFKKAGSNVIYSDWSNIKRIRTK